MMNSFIICTSLQMLLELCEEETLIAG